MCRTNQTLYSIWQCKGAKLVQKAFIWVCCRNSAIHSPWQTYWCNGITPGWVWPTFQQTLFKRGFVVWKLDMWLGYKRDQTQHPNYGLCCADCLIPYGDESSLLVPSMTMEILADWANKMPLAIIIIRRLHCAANALISCPAGDFIRTDVAIHKPKEDMKRESSCPHLSPGFQSGSELVHFTINYLMFLQFNTRVSKIFSAKMMGVIYAVYFCIKNVTFWWQFSTPVIIAYIPYHTHHHELQTYLQLVDQDSFVYLWYASINVIFSVS